MRVLVLGATGMLGHTAFHYFSRHPDFETWGTLRSVRDLKYFGNAHRDRLLPNVDVLNLESVIGVLATVQPEVVINAVGLVKQLAAADDPLVALPLNALFPHRLASLCGLAGARMIHVSTDCVFSGRKGGYGEDDPSDAEDLYGRSKYIGEVRDVRHVLTLRTSGIGHELNSRLGLLEWFLSEQGRVKGFSNAIYSGLPWVELAHVIEAAVLPHPELYGVYHVASDAISKLRLLHLFSEAYDHPIEIVPDDEVRIDRSLDASRFRVATGYSAPPWPEMIERMREFHAGLRGEDA